MRLHIDPLVNLLPQSLFYVSEGSTLLTLLYGHHGKEKSTEKIDGAVATIMGLDRAIRCGNNTGASVYDERGILFI